MSEQLSRQEIIEKRRALWKKHIESWRSSGMTQTAYCIEHELKGHQFSYWKKRFVQTESGITFVPVKIQRNLHSKASASSATMRLIFGGDVAIEIEPDFDSRFLRRLIATLRSL